MTPVNSSPRKGLRFEVYAPQEGYLPSDPRSNWYWKLIGKDGPICRSEDLFDTEEATRSNIHTSKSRMKASGFAKVITIHE